MIAYSTILGATTRLLETASDVEPEGLGFAGGLVVAILLIAASFFFVATEFAIVAVRRSRVDQLVAKGHANAFALQATLKDLDRYIAGTQVGITLANLGLGWIGEPVLAKRLGELLDFLPASVSPTVSHAIATVIALFVLTTVTVVIGEMVPKSLALRYPERMALWVVRPLRASVFILSPLVDFLNGFSNLILKLCRLPTPKAHTITPDELRYVVEQAEQSGVFEEHEADVVRGALRFSDTLVRQVMVHRRDVECLDASLSPEDLYRAAAKLRHSRVLVYRGEMDRVVGLLHVKDLLKQQPSDLQLSRVLRAPLWVTPDTPIPDLVAALRRKRTRMALVTDEFGGFFGLVTLEDAAEVVLGEVLDEHEMPRAPITPDAEGRFETQGAMRLQDLQEALDHEFEERAVTVGGFLMRHLGRLPESGERIEIEGFVFEVESVNGTQIGKVRCAPPAAPKETAPESGA